MGSDDLTYYAYVETAENGKLYVRFPKAEDKLDAGFTGPFAQAWQGSAEAVRWLADAEASGMSIPAVYLPKTGKVYFMHDSTYVRCTMATHTVDEGFPKSIAAYWGEMKPGGFDGSIDAALSWDENALYFLKGDQYVRYNLTADKVDEGYPKAIGSYWTGFLEAGFGSHIDAAVRSDTDTAYVFKGEQYLRFNIPTDKVDQAPRRIVDHWNAFAQAGVRRVLAIWAAPAVQAPVTSGTGSPAQANGGFPAGNFKIKNVETGQCLQAFLGKVGDTRYASDGKGGVKTEDHPQAERNIPYLHMQPCSDSREQVWRYNAKNKRLESVGVEGRIASLGPNMTMADAMSHSRVVGRSTPPPPKRDDAVWKVGLESRDTSSTPQMLRFKTEGGYIMLADPLAEYGDEEETYWTAEGDGDLVGRAKGRPAQKWTFPKAP